MSNLTKNLLTIVAILIALLIVTVGSACAQSNVQLAVIRDGKVKILAYRPALELTSAWNNPKARKALKQGEWLIGPSITEEVSVTVKDVDSDLLTVSAEGFLAGESIAIRQALEAWNVGITRFVFQGSGQIKIRKQATGYAALSTMQIVDGVLITADVCVNPAITNANALRSTIAHEAGHWLGLSDSKNRKSVMYFESRGKNKGNGHAGPTALDFAALRGKLTYGLVD